MRRSGRAVHKISSSQVASASPRRRYTLTTQASAANSTTGGDMKRSARSGKSVQVRRSPTP